MPVEIRKVAFTLEETHAALGVYAKKTGKVVPSEAISEMAPDGVGRIKVVFGSKEIFIPEKEFMTALLVFCQEKRIPIPKEAKKTLKMEEKLSVLVMKYS